MPTGSATTANTIGISEVAFAAARAACGEIATMRSGLAEAEAACQVGGVLINRFEASNSLGGRPNVDDDRATRGEVPQGVVLRPAS